MFKLDASEAFNYPLRGRNSFLVAALLIPAAIIGIIVTVAGAVALSGQVNPNTEQLQLVKLTLAVTAVILVLIAAPCVLLTGFFIRATRAVGRGVTGVLPGWGNLPELFLTGLGSWVVGLGLGLLPLATLGLIIAWSMTSLGLGQEQQHAAFSRAIASGGAFLVLGGFLLLALLACVLAPMANLRYAMSGSVLAALNPAGLVRDILRAPGDYVLCLLAPMGLNSVAGGVMSIVPPLLLLYLPFTVYSQLFTANLLGQYWRLHVAEARPE